MEVERVMLHDVNSVLQNLNAVLGGYVTIPEKGLFLPGRSKPAIVASDDKYYIYRLRGDTYRVPGTALCAELQFMTVDVYTEDGVLVVPAYMVEKLSDVPDVPSSVIRLFMAIVDHTLCARFAFSAIRKTSTHEIIRPYLSITDEVELGRLGDAVGVCLSGTVESLYAFVDTDVYKLHTASLKDSTLRVEKHIDYRIHVFNEKRANGEWLDGV